MSEGEKKAQRWKDSRGTEWHVLRREAGLGLKAGWILRRVGYSFVAWEEASKVDANDLQSFVDRHTARGPSDGTTARLWMDHRNRTEWEVFETGKELHFQRGIESFSVTRGWGASPPRSLEDHELLALLDEAKIPSDD